MSDTPRSDNYPTPKHGYVQVGFARELERENNALRTALEKCRQQANAVDETPAGRFSRIYSAADQALKR